MARPRRQESDGFSHIDNQVNKDPFYRTNDMLNGVFKRAVRLKTADVSMTDGKHTVYVNFNQVRIQTISGEARESEGRRVYSLSCGHEFVASANRFHATGEEVTCYPCGGKDAYRSFEHEWSHIIFKSDGYLWRAFIDQYVTQLRMDGYAVDSLMGLKEFLYHVINAFDDLRVTSLWELVYPGSAWEIESKWRRLCEDNPRLNENFVAWIFGVALDAENLNTQDGPLSDLIPIMIKATDLVRGKGTANMLHAIRWAIDKCVKRLLEKAPTPPPPPPPTKSDPPPDGPPQGMENTPQSSQKGLGDVDASSLPSPSPGGDSSKNQAPVQPNEPPDPYFGGDPKDMKNPFIGMAQEQRTEEPPKDKTEALNKLAQGHSPLQSDEDHTHPDSGDEDPNSVMNTAILQKVLWASLDGDDLQPLGVDNNASVQAALAQLRAAAQQDNSHQFLLASAKSNIVMVDVKPGDINKSKSIQLSPQEKQLVGRMKAVFTKVMGRASQKMHQEGSNVDVQSVIQYLLNPTEDQVFNVEDVIKGFAYMTLCDMSGSMMGTRFSQVTSAAEMLKESLDYPFVEGHLWGFRGASRDGGGRNNMGRGEIWLYRYDKNCQGYIADSALGIGPQGGKRQIPVNCGGLTPMNSALHVALKYLHTHVPQGMAKRLFLLTDGFPTQFRTDGSLLSEGASKRFVTKEIMAARMKGTQVYTIIIGSSIPDKQATEMFGPKRYWERTTEDLTVGQALFNLVVREFIHYLRRR